MALSAHNPEVAGSNPAPATNASAHYHRSTARKLSLRVVFVSGGGMRSDQIADQDRLWCPAVSQVVETLRDA